MVAMTEQHVVPVQKWSLWSACAVIAVLAGAASISHAQPSAWHPERTIEIVVPAAAGGSIDGTARLIQKILQDRRIVNVPVVTMNKPAGGGSIALNYLGQYAGDGHYLHTSTLSLMTNHIQGRSKVTYTDFTPLATLFGEYMTVVVKPESPLKTGRDIQERLTKDPRSLSIAIGLAIGSSGHLTIALLAKAMGVDVRQLKTVIFPSNANAMTALMGGHVDLSAMSMGAAWRAAQQGGVRIIGITSDKRGEGALADIPTWKEQGFDVVFTNTRLLVGPKAMTPAQIAYWDAALEKVVQSEEWKGTMRDNHWTADYLGSKQSPIRMAEIYAQLRGALADAGLAKQ
jgi:putative tricarboxylic transport membrane protein